MRMYFFVILYRMDSDDNNVVVDSISMEVPMTDQEEIPTTTFKEEFITEQNQQAFRQAYIFVCELCNDSFTQQLKFFEHLKAHYGNGDIQETQNLVEIQNDEVQTEFEIVASTTEHDGDATPVIVTSTLTYNIETNNPKEIIRTSFKKEKQTVGDHVGEENSNKSAILTKILLACPKCKRTFRREKTFQSHVESCHKQIEQDDETLIYETETVKIKPKVIMSKLNPYYRLLTPLLASKVT